MSKTTGHGRKSKKVADFADSPHQARSTESVMEASDSDGHDTHIPEGSESNLVALIERSRVESKSSFAALSKLIQEQTQAVIALTTRVAEVEDRVSSIEDGAAAMRTLFPRMDSFETRVSNIEDISSRRAVKVLGLPESAEGADAVDFTEKWVAEFLGIPPNRAMVDNAYRVGARGAAALPRAASRASPSTSQNASVPTRPLIVRFVRSSTSTALLAASRRSRGLKLTGAEIRVVPDLPQQVRV